MSAHNKKTDPDMVPGLVDKWLDELEYHKYLEEFDNRFDKSGSELDMQIMRNVNYQITRLINRFAMHMEATLIYAEYRLSENHKYRQSTKFGDASEAFMYEPGLSDMEIMTRLRDSIESFHEQVYKVISSAWLMCQKMNNSPFSGKLPNARQGKGNKKFLDWLIGPEAKSFKFSSSFYKSVQALEESRKFRSEHLEHFDDPSNLFYMTQNIDENFFIIYYEPKDPNSPYNFREDEVTALHPDHFNYQPPVSCKGFVVSPEITKTLRAILLFCKELIKRC